MNDKNNSFIAGMLTGAVIFALTLVFVSLIKYDMKEKIEDAKIEHLTIKYKNGKCGIADKEMLVNIMKQHFPTSSWSHIDNKASENYVELDVWSTSK